MLSPQSSMGTSTIQTRRRHQLQQQQQSQPRTESLEVPVLTAKLSGSSTTTSPQLSPTQLQSSTLSPTFERLNTDQEESTNNTGRPISQHSHMQGAQLHSAAQPGHRHPQLQSQQQTPYDPRMIDPQLAQKMMQEQQAAVRQAIAAQQGQYAQFVHMMPRTAVTGATTPVLMPRATTPPDAYLPSPPATHRTGGRMMRQVDSAAVAVNLGRPAMLAIPTSDAGVDMQLFQDANGGIYEYAYVPSYPSSMASASPHMAHDSQGMVRGIAPMILPPGGIGHYSPISPMLSQQQMMMEGMAGERYYFSSGMPPSPRDAMRAQFEKDATIEDTGISAEEVAQYIAEPSDAADHKWECLFPECGKRFGRKENIRSHVQTHLGDRQFRCKHCGKCFVRQHDLKRHAKIHSGDKPHKCPCGNGFARQDALTRHRQRGVCRGALPGFVRREVKRGRPRKHHPEMNERLEKAARSRRMDAAVENGADNELDQDDEFGAYSSSSSPSDSGSDPYTPPHMDDAYDFAAELVAHTNAGTEAYTTGPQIYQETPPTSPAGTNMTGAVSPPSAWPVDDFHAGFELAATNSRDNSTSPRVSRRAQQTSTPAVDAFDFAAPMSSQHIDPEMLASPTQPAVQHSNNSGSALHDSPVEEMLLVSSSSMTEPSPFSSDYGFDWGAIEAQPSLVMDSEHDVFSPAAMTSPAATDLFADEALEAWDLGASANAFRVSSSGKFGSGSPGVMVGADGEQRVDELFADLLGDMEWAS